MRTDEQHDKTTQIPRWLVYGFLAKGILVVVVTIAVLYYAGVF